MTVNSIIHNSFTFKIKYEKSVSMIQNPFTIDSANKDEVANINKNKPYYINRFNKNATEITRSNKRFIKLYHSPNSGDDEYASNYIQYNTPGSSASKCDSTYCADLNKIKENSLFNSITTLDASLDNSIDNSKYVFRDKMYCATECTNSNEKSAFESSDIKYIADEIMDDTYTKIIFKHDDSHQEPSSDENGWKGTIYTLNIERNTPSDDSELLDCSVLIVGGGGGGGGNCGGGGGGGSVVYIDNIELYSKTSYKIKVGKGGIGAYYNEDKSGYMINGETGYYSSIGNSIVALGGGGGGCNLETNKRLKNFEDIIDAKYDDTEKKFTYEYSGKNYDLKFEGMDDNPDNPDNDGKYGKGIDGGSGGGSCAWWCDISDLTKINKGKGKGKSYDNSAFKDYSRYHSQQNDGEVSYINHTITGDYVYHPLGETKLIGVGGGGGGAGSSGSDGNGGNGTSIEELNGKYCDIFNLDDEGSRCFTQVSQEDNKIYNKKLIRERNEDYQIPSNVLLGAGGGGGSLDKHPGKGGDGGGGSGGVYYRDIIDSHGNSLTGYDISNIIGITNSGISSTADNTNINKNDIFINNKLEFIKYNRDTSRYCPKDTRKLSDANAIVDQLEYSNVKAILDKLSSELQSSVLSDDNADPIEINLDEIPVIISDISQDEKKFLYNYIIQIDGNKFYCKRQQPDGLPGKDNTGSGGGGGGLYGDGGDGGSGLVVLLIKSTDKIKGTQKPENELNITKDFRKTVDYFQLLKKDLGVN